MALPWLAAWQSVLLARRLEIDLIASTSWLALLAVFLFLGLIPILAWTLTWFSAGERILSFLEFPEHLSRNLRWSGWIILLASFIGYTAVFTIPFIQKLFGGEVWIRLLVLWSFSLIGLAGFKIIRPESAWFASLLTVVLIQMVIQILASQLTYVTNYPFSMGWSETSRYYYPSLFLSKFVFGREYPWPVLHPTLHLLLIPPYLAGAPLWAHRLWQVLTRLILVGAVVPALMRRLSIQEKAVCWLVALGAFLYLFIGPLYFHLAIPVILVLIGYSPHDGRKNWLVLLFGSAWCGWSRVNWFPVPAIIMAVLYILERPFKGKSLFQYLWKPALWGVTGLLTAFAFQRIYVAVSGVENNAYFYTSLVSDLLWYRLFPSATFPTGLLPTAVLVSFPLWLVVYQVLQARKNTIHSLRLSLLLMALIVLFTAGLLVSLKIGGGADLHNMDSYSVVLLIVTGYLAFVRYRREDEEFDQPVPVHWMVVILMMVVLVWSHFRSNVGIRAYDSSRTDAVLSTLQEQVDQVNAQNGEILFITQRHLISMGLLNNVTLVPEYEREDLMEMAMAGNDEYLARFTNDMKNQRFYMIVVDLLKFRYLGPERSFGEENNVWVRHVMKPLLCNYRQDVIFPEDDIALYVPQVGERQCP